jgi:hypothetical protein
MWSVKLRQRGFSVPITGQWDIALLTEVEDDISNTIASRVGIIQSHRSGASNVGADRVNTIAVPITGKRRYTLRAKKKRRDIDRSLKSVTEKPSPFGGSEHAQGIDAIAIPISGERNISVQSEVEGEVDDRCVVIDVLAVETIRQFALIGIGSKYAWRIHAIAIPITNYSKIARLSEVDCDNGGIE